MVLLANYAASTLTMVTSFSRAERTHSVSLSDAKANLYKYLALNDVAYLQEYKKYIAKAHSYSHTFGTLPEIITTKSHQEAVSIYDEVFSEVNRKEADIVITRTYLLLWHPLVKQLIAIAADADKTTGEYETIIEKISTSKNQYERKNLLAQLKEIEVRLEILPKQFSDAVGELANFTANVISIALWVIYILLMSISFFIVFKIVRSITNPLQHLKEAFKSLSEGIFTVSFPLEGEDEIGSLSSSANSLKEALQLLSQDTNILLQSAINGKLDVRANDSKHKGDFQKIVAGLNHTLDSVVEPLNVAADYIDKISKGDIPKPITHSYQGDFNAIKNNLNLLIDSQEKIAEVAKNLSSGNTNLSISPRSENDTLINSIIKMVNNIKHIVEEVNSIVKETTNGNLSKRGEYSQHNGSFQEIVLGLNRTLDAMTAPIQEATNVLSEMSNGNLVIRMNGNYKGDHAIIADALNNTLDSFTALLLQIQMASEQILVNSKQLAHSSQVLSQGSSQQASSIEEMTAALTQIEAQAKHNTETADATSVTAKKVNEGANTGSIEMKELVQAMDELNTSSQKIYLVIREIESIAFQTNILALNAAVEAARAGQHGKGFNVVATEVRNLATRSATSAKETAVMVDETIKKIALGTKLAQNTSGSLFTIAEDIANVTRLIEEITASSKEQTSAIMQVNSGIHEISQVTMSNAAASEEMAASSEELSGQAESFREMVGNFKLEDEKKKNTKHKIILSNYSA
jgi:methyl-accepting chemotaxis protein